MTHGLRYLKDWRPDAVAPTWSSDFDLWAATDTSAAPETLIEGYFMGLFKRSILVA